MLWSLRAEGITHPLMSFQSGGVPLSSSPSLTACLFPQLCDSLMVFLRSWCALSVEQHVFT